MDKLDVLSAGPAVANPSELVASENMDMIIEKLEDKYTYIIIDTPAVNYFTDSVEIAKKVSGMIMVVRSNETSLCDIDAAMSRIEFFEANMLGFVLNNVKTDRKHNKFIAPSRKVVPINDKTDAQMMNKRSSSRSGRSMNYNKSRR